MIPSQVALWAETGRAATCCLLHLGNRPPHRWRGRGAERHFVIGYLGEADNPAANRDATIPERWRYAAAIFRLTKSPDRLLLWVADEEVGSALRRVEGVHAATHCSLWRASEEARQWTRLVEEFGQRAEFRAYAAFAEFEHAVDGLIRPSLRFLPHDLLDDQNAFAGGRNFDLWDRAN